MRQTLERGEGILNNTGALLVNTGDFTGRSPADKFVVKDLLTQNRIDWNKFNNPISTVHFLNLQKDLLIYLKAQNKIWVRDAFVCADTTHRFSIRIITKTPWSCVLLREWLYGKSGRH